MVDGHSAVKQSQVFEKEQLILGCGERGRRYIDCGESGIFDSRLPHARDNEHSPDRVALTTTDRRSIAFDERSPRRDNKDDVATMFGSIRQLLFWSEYYNSLKLYDLSVV